MSGASNSPQAASTIDDAAQAAGAILISQVKNTKDTATTDVEAKQVIEQIRSGHYRQEITEIRDKYWRVMEETGNDRKAAKAAVDSRKKRLPGALWSATFTRRRQNAVKQPSGLLCADLDGLGRKAMAEVRAELQASPYLWALFDSPTRDGLKAVFRVPADAEKQKASFRAVKNYVDQLVDLPIDEACSDVSRICFLSWDPDVFLNENAIELPALTSDKDKPIAAVAEPVGDAEIERRRRVAAELFGEIRWVSETRGYGSCPGQDLHTTTDGERDLRIHLDGVPNAFCVHNSCRDIVEGRNRELLSRIPNGAAPKNILTLPSPIDALQLLGSDLKEPPELICGILHQGSKMEIGGGSKSFKTWTLTDLAVSVAKGISWWGFPTNQGRVLYMNFELQDPFFKKRLANVCTAKDCKLEEGQLSYWGLRGKAADLSVLMPQIVAMLKDGSYSLIIFDPIYKALGGRDENKAGDIASLLNEFEALAVETDAAVAFGHHFSKGNQAGKESIDRIGGSGVFSRDPDTILTMTKHEQDDAFTIDPVLRNFPPVAPFVVRRAHPLMVRDDKLDPNDLKKPNRSQEKYSDKDILAPLHNGGMTTTQWQRKVYLDIGLSESGFHVRRRKLEERSLIEKEGNKWTLAGK
jgi:hypothetical protein